MGGGGRGGTLCPYNVIIKCILTNWSTNLIINISCNDCIICTDVLTKYCLLHGFLNLYCSKYKSCILKCELFFNISQEMFQFLLLQPNVDNPRRIGGSLSGPLLFITFNLYHITYASGNWGFNYVYFWIKGGAKVRRKLCYWNLVSLIYTFDLLKRVLINSGRLITNALRSIILARVASELVSIWRRDAHI